ncbi:MAG: DNA-directed RNA polymerase subunit omega [Chlorobi bacterium]|nr:DNA-directed RNA polymerase subunit omega [Chlorobiota bacterium]
MRKDYYFKELKTDPYIQTRDIIELWKKTGNLFKSVRVISHRANQIQADLLALYKEEVEKVTGGVEFVAEEMQEAIEKIAIEYEKLPKPTLLATEEFMQGKTYWRFLSEGEGAEESE